MNSLFHAPFSWLSAVVVSFKNSLKYKYLRKTWPMQVWIPVVSWSLYFWKSVFSFRADSILKSDGDFISNWKFPDCVHFFGAWARQAAIETVAVVYEHTKRTQETCIIVLLGTIIQSIFFVPNQEPASAWILEMVRWESVPRGSFARTWKLSSRLFTRPDWLPLGFRGKTRNAKTMNVVATEKRQICIKTKLRFFEFRMCGAMTRISSRITSFWRHNDVICDEIRAIAPHMPDSKNYNFDLMQLFLFSVANTFTVFAFKYP